MRGGGGCINDRVISEGREKKRTNNGRVRNNESEKADKVKVVPGATVASLNDFTTALIGPTKGLPKRR